MNKKLRNDLILITVLVLGGLIFLLYRQLTVKAGAYAVVDYSGGQESLDLSKDGIYDFESNSYIIHIEVRDGAAAFVNSPCPDHICEAYGYLKNDAEMAVCLPARATLTIRH